MNYLMFCALSALLMPLSGALDDVSVYTTQKPEQFVLLTMLYHEKNPQRIAEYVECLERNRMHPWISHLHVLYDNQTNDCESSPLFAYLTHHQITTTMLPRRATFGDFFVIANTQYRGLRIIISNADIYFNDTLTALVDYDLHDRFLALTRWDVQADETLVPYQRLYGDSQDVWIFQAPLRAFAHDGIALGLLDCDGRIAFQARQAGLKVINPSKSVQCCHLHHSEIRHYGSRTTPYPKYEALIVRGSYL